MANGARRGGDRRPHLESWLRQIDPALQSYARQHRMTLTEGTGQLRDRSLNWRHGNLKLRPHIVLDDPTLITFTVRAMAWQTRPVERPFNREVLAPSVMGITLKSNLIAFLEDGRKLLEGWAEEELAGPDS